MPRLPTYQDVANVAPARDPGVNAPLAAFQSGAGIIAGELAPGINDVAAVVREEEKRKDNAAVNDYRRQLLELETEKDEWLSQQNGENAFSAKAKLDKDIDARVAKIKEGLKNDRQRILAKEVEGDWRVGVNRKASRYIASEMDNHYDNSDKGLIEASTRAAQKSASVGDFDRVQQEWADQEKVIAGYADRKGLDASQRKAMLDSRKSNFHTGITIQLIADGDDNSAQKYLDANKNEFDADDSLKIQNMLKSRQNEKASEYRVAIADKMQDIEAMGTRGVIPPKGFIPDSEIEIAYSKNPERIAQIKRRRDEGYRFAFKASSVHQETNDQIISDLNKPFVQSGSPENFAEQARHDDMLKQMRANVLKQRLTTPMEYAKQQNVGVVNDLDFKNTTALSDEIGNRQRTAKIMQDRFGSPIQLLTAQESANFSRSMSQATPSQKRQLFQTFAGTLGDDMTSYRSIMSQIAPDDPVTAMAGISANRKEATQKGQFVSDLMLRGQAILHPPKKSDGDPDKGSLIPMPAENDMRRSFDSTVREAFTGMSDNVRSNYYQAARAIYAARSMDAGDKDTTQLNGDRWEEAINLSIGPIEKYNGKRTILPTGYDKSSFKDELRIRVKALAVSGRLAEGMTEDRLEDLPVQPYGDGKYVFVSGDSHLGDKDGQRIIIDFNQHIR